MTRTPCSLLIFHMLYATFMLAPLAIVVLVSFTDKGYISMPFEGASWRWFLAILESDWLLAFQRSLLLAACAATLTILLAIPAGMAIAWYSFRGREVLLALLLSPLMIPPVVLGIAMLRFLTQLGWSGTMSGLVAAHMVIIMPYALRLVVTAATGFDRSMAHAAESLGASSWTVFRRIKLPALMPGIAGGWLISFITSFDELSLTVFVSGASTQTLPVKMYAYIAQTIDPLVAAISTVLLVLTLIAIIIIERFFGLDRMLGGNAR